MYIVPEIFDLWKPTHMHSFICPLSIHLPTSNSGQGCWGARSMSKVILIMVYLAAFHFSAVFIVWLQTLSIPRRKIQVRSINTCNLCCHQEQVWPKPGVSCLWWVTEATLAGWNPNFQLVTVSLHACCVLLLYLMKWCFIRHLHKYRYTTSTFETKAWGLSTMVKPFF